MNVAVNTGPIIGFRHGRGGTLVSTYPSISDFSKGLVAVLVSGPSPGDSYIDRSLNKFVVTAVKSTGAGLLARMESIFSPKCVVFDLELQRVSTVTLDQLKSSIESAMKSSKSASEYWDEGHLKIDLRIKRILGAKTFDEVCRALRH